MEEARSLLIELLPQSKRLPRHTSSDDSKRRKIANDLLKVCLGPNLQLPTFCSTDIRRIPPVGLEHVDVSSLLQEVSALRAEVRFFVSLRTEISDIRKDLAHVRASCQAVITGTSVSVSCSRRELYPSRPSSQAVTEDSTGLCIIIYLFREHLATVQYFRTWYSSNVRVINDIAERGIKLITDFIGHCHDESQRQALLQVVESHREQFPDYL